ncbi:protease [Dictyobacter kobayashii]|uniref:Protease n=2 Tax=Dictyobacter kobayashii TaxID=2014872 RepID=A0A402ARS8_9CHLR|nr:protease [Dictyobacter kobayashii]
MNEPHEIHEPQMAAEPAALDGQSRPPAQRRHSRQLSAGTLVICALLLATVFGGGMLAGWQFVARGALGTDLQPGPNAAPTIKSSTEDELEALREQIVANVRPTVVQLNVKGLLSNSLGSGVIIDQRGYIITNNHVVKNSEHIQVVFFNGQTATASLTGVAPADDLAVIHVDPSRLNLSVATLGDSSRLRVGQDVVAIGNPLGITQTVTSGIVSALGRNIATGEVGQILPGTIQTDAAINPGNSGGALFDMHGNLIGIPTLTALDPEFKTPATGVGFAIPSNRVQFIAPQIIKSGKVTRTGRAALEVQVVDLDLITAQKNHLPVKQGALVVSVTAGGAANLAGIKSSDVIVQVDDRQITGSLSLGDALIARNPGDTVKIKLYRGSKPMTFEVKLSELPAGNT